MPDLPFPQETRPCCEENESRRVLGLAKRQNSSHRKGHTPTKSRACLRRRLLPAKQKSRQILSVLEASRVRPFITSLDKLDVVGREEPVLAVAGALPPALVFCDEQKRVMDGDGQWGARCEREYRKANSPSPEPSPICSMSVIMSSGSNVSSPSSAA